MTDVTYLVVWPTQKLARQLLGNNVSFYINIGVGSVFSFPNSCSTEGCTTFLDEEEFMGVKLYFSGNQRSERHWKRRNYVFYHPVINEFNIDNIKQSLCLIKSMYDFEYGTYQDKQRDKVIPDYTQSKKDINDIIRTIAITSKRCPVVSRRLIDSIYWLERAKKDLTKAEKGVAKFKISTKLHDLIDQTYSSMTIMFEHRFDEKDEYRFYI